jgi:hypothetical protein
MARIGLLTHMTSAPLMRRRRDSGRSSVINRVFAQISELRMGAAKADPLPFICLSDTLTAAQLSAADLSSFRPADSL